MAYILHIDTSGDEGLVALAKEGRVLDKIINTESRSHAANLNTNIEQILAGQGITLADIDAFCVCGGPGSYTGLRIGLATAKGFCYVLNKPLMQHSRLLLMAYDAWHSKADTAAYSMYQAIMPARQGEYFVASYDGSMAEVVAPRHILEDELGDFVMNSNTCTIGELPAERINLIEKNDAVFHSSLRADSVIADSWAYYAYGQYQKAAFEDLANVTPLYLKQVFTHK